MLPGVVVVGSAHPALLSIIRDDKMEIGRASCRERVSSPV